MARGEGKLVVGPVHSYGLLGGVLAMYGEKVGKLEVIQNVVRNPSVENCLKIAEGVNIYRKGSELIYDDGVFYGLAKNRFFTYNCRTSAMRMLETNVASIEQDNDGTIFLSKGTKLYRYQD